MANLHGVVLCLVSEEAAVLLICVCHITYMQVHFCCCHVPLQMVSRGALLVHEPKVKVDLTKYTETHEFTFDEVRVISEQKYSYLDM